jgi:hypothetical protein
MKFLFAAIWLTGLVNAQTNVPVYTPRATVPQAHVPQPAQPLRPADPFAPPPPNTGKPVVPPRFTPPPSARDLAASALKPAAHQPPLPPLPTATTAVTNLVVEPLGGEQGVPVTNRPPQTSTP